MPESKIENTKSKELNLPYIPLFLGQIGQSKQCRHRSDCSLPLQLLEVFFCSFSKIKHDYNNLLVSEFSVNLWQFETSTITLSIKILKSCMDCKTLS